MLSTKTTTATRTRTNKTGGRIPVISNVIAPCGEWVCLQVQLTSEKQEQPQTDRGAACLDYRNWNGD
jgi:hypothetical protein